MTGPSPPGHASGRVALSTVAGQWTRIGCIGFGGPPAHISLLRRLCVTDRKWLTDRELEDGIAATNLLPGPASTQLAIYCAWRVRGAPGALLGGLGFILPGLVLILALAAVFLGSPPVWLQGAAAGAGAAVPAVALHAAFGLAPASWRRSGGARWIAYLTAGLLAGALAGAWLALVLLACGLVEVAARSAAPTGPAGVAVPLLLTPPAAGLGALSWVALKVGLLSYGGGFVIIPLMYDDAVGRYHWMTDGQFLQAVALGQLTPGPVVLTVAVVGYAAAGVGGALLAALVAFAPSFAMVLIGASRFDALRRQPQVQAFLRGAGPAVIGAIAGSAVPLTVALDHPWQLAVLAAAALMLALRRGALTALLAAAALGVGAALAGQPVGA